MFELKESTDGQFYFVLKADNGHVLMTSETYTTKQAAREGIDASKKVVKGMNALSTWFKDLTKE